MPVWHIKFLLTLCKLKCHILTVGLNNKFLKSCKVINRGYRFVEFHIFEFLSDNNNLYQQSLGIIFVDNKKLLHDCIILYIF